MKLEPELMALTKAELRVVIDRAVNAIAKLERHNERLAGRVRFLQRRLDREMNDAMMARRAVKDREQRQAQQFETLQMLGGSND